MSNKEALFCSVMIIVMAILTGVVGHIGAKTGIARECDREQTFTADGYKYDCRLVGKARKVGL